MSPRQTMLSVILAILCILAVSTSSVQAASPQVSVSRFTNLPTKLVYIDDTSVVLYHDSAKGDVYRSEDEGKSWKPVDGPPKGKAYLLVEHPYDLNMVRELKKAGAEFKKKAFLITITLKSYPSCRSLYCLMQKLTGGLQIKAELGGLSRRRKLQRSEQVLRGLKRILPSIKKL